jgi:aspartokinase-like uncharacterized kinase
MHPSVENRPRTGLKDRYQILTRSGENVTLGSGTFGNVVRAKEKTTGQNQNEGHFVAIKCFKKVGDGISIDRCREISVCRELIVAHFSVVEGTLSRKHC